MEQFNPCLRNFIAMGKSYEKALTSVTSAAKGYFNALVRMGEMASDSQGSKDLGEVLFQLAEVHRQIQIQLEEMLKSFHNELLTELEKKVELDARYLNAALRKYQTEHRSKGESLEKCQAELKKLRRKSQSSKQPSKYGDKELQFVEAVSGKQSELEACVADGYRNALSEERRRFCFLVDRQAAAARGNVAYHSKGKELLVHNLPLWQQTCADANKPSDRSMFLPPPPGAAHARHPGAPLVEGGAKALAMPPELLALRSAGGQQVSPCAPQRRMEGAMVNGAAGDYQPWMEEKAGKSQRGGDVYSNTLPVRKAAPAKSRNATMETRTLPRSSSMAAGLERNGRTRVQAVFSHAAGDNSTLLSFNEGDIITLLVPEARDGWHYGENDKNRMRGWFPFSYTRLVSDAGQLPVPSLHQGRSSSTGNLLERDDVLSVPDYVLQPRVAALHGRQQHPYNVTAPSFPQQSADEYEPRFPPSSSEGKLISTV